MRRHPIIQMLVIGSMASAIGIALALTIHWFPTDAAKQDAPIDTLYDVLMIVSVPVFVLVATVVLYSVWAFRMRPGQENEDGPPIHGNTRLEVVWTAVPAILLVSLCSYAYAVLHDIEKKHANELVVHVTAVQFAWQFTYPQGGKPVTTTQLYLPQGRPVRFDITTQDVLHDFWVPAFRVKIDTVPGITTQLRVTPTRLGTYPVVCAELCGLGHSVMRSTAHVLPPARFTAWLAKQRQPVAAGGAGGGGKAPSKAQLLALGKQTFTTTGGCGACHTLADAGTSGTSGPDLGKTLRGKDAAFIRTSIVDPNAQIAAGYPANVMPQSFGQSLSSQQLDGLVAYLANVSK